jgi:hypothetical protein
VGGRALRRRSPRSRHRERRLMKAGRDFLMTGLVLVGLYLVLTRAGGATKLIGASTSGVAKIYKTLQGR